MVGVPSAANASETSISLPYNQLSHLPRSSTNAGPAVIIFDTNRSSFLPNPSLISWVHGPVKQETFVKRGRPRKESARPSARPSAKSTHRQGDQDDTAEWASRHFEFVNCLDKLPAKARKAIRSHVMHDFRRRQKKGGSKESGAGGDLSSRSAADGPAGPQLQAIMKLSPVEPSAATLDPFDTLPVRVDTYIRDMLSLYISSVSLALYSIERYTKFNPTTQYWLPMVFQDAALFHSIIACSDSFLAVATGIRERPSAVMHLREASRLVNKRLQNPSGEISDATMVVVSTLAIMEKITGNHANWRIHMRGLRQIVRLKGGEENLKRNRLIYAKICRSDLCGHTDVLQRGSFGESMIIRASQPITPITYSSKGFQDIHAVIGLENELNFILNQLSDVTSTINKLHSGNIEIEDPLSLRETITSIQYTLLSMDHIAQEPNSNPARSLIQEICRLGILLYLVNIVHEFPQGASVCDTLVSELLQLFNQLADFPADYELTLKLRLWLMFLAASIAASDEVTALIWTELVDEIGPKLGIESWDGDSNANGGGATEILKEFFWINKIHEDSLLPVWRHYHNLKTMNEVSRAMLNNTISTAVQYSKSKACFSS